MQFVGEPAIALQEVRKKMCCFGELYMLGLTDMRETGSHIIYETVTNLIEGYFTSNIRHKP